MYLAEDRIVFRISLLTHLDDDFTERLISPKLGYGPMHRELVNAVVDDLSRNGDGP